MLSKEIWTKTVEALIDEYKTSGANADKKVAPTDETKLMSVIKAFTTDNVLNVINERLKPLRIFDFYNTAFDEYHFFANELNKQLPNNENMPVTQLIAEEAAYLGFTNYNARTLTRFDEHRIFMEEISDCTYVTETGKLLIVTTVRLINEQENKEFVYRTLSPKTASINTISFDDLECCVNGEYSSFFTSE